MPIPVFPYGLQQQENVVSGRMRVRAAVLAEIRDKHMRAVSLNGGVVHADARTASLKRAMTWQQAMNSNY